ncbi:probable cytochrome P450 6a14 [Macrosteles quadrilineatus]|uniref:probable cytochrome P450 6a14 n=1 Tax=Macrosteles quadrilineatus TaxID=74068 RepID=UPI0023E2AFDC|nr:probable cytochrome P450 6a14 [Macrosteles quadrilineatus]
MCYEKFKPNGYGGVFLLNTPALYVCRPSLIEKVLVEDFPYFHDRLSKEDGRYPLVNTLSYCTGEEWKTLRSRVAPAFSSGKVSGMFNQILSSTDRVLQKISLLNEFRERIEVENMATTYTTEVLASCLFGVEVTNVDQYHQLEESLNALFNPSLVRYIIMVMGLVNQKLYNLLKLERIPKKAMETFTNMIRDIIHLRKKEMTTRDDVLQTMLNLNSEEINYTGEINTDSSNESISLLMFNFMTAGIKPTAVTITFALYEIAKYNTIQDTILKEITEAISKHGGWSYEALKEMTYLDLVIQETLRLHSFNPALIRSVTKPYTLPGTSLTLEKDMMVCIPVDGLHADPEFYPSPEEFRPERWTGNDYKESSIFLPFGGGPRACVSIDLAVLTIKLCLARVLVEHRVGLDRRMSVPLDMDKRVFYPKVKKGMWIIFSKRDGYNYCNA